MKPADIPLALIVVVIWGLNFIVINIGLQDLPPILFVALRFVVAALPLAFFVARPAVPFRLLAGYALFQFAAQFTLLFYGLQFGFPPGLASLVIQLQAFFTIGFGVLLLGERPRPSQLLGALIAFCGIGLVASYGWPAKIPKLCSRNAASNSTLRPSAAAMISAVCRARAKGLAMMRDGR